MGLKIHVLLFGMTLATGLGVSSADEIETQVQFGTTFGAEYCTKTPTGKQCSLPLLTPQNVTIQMEKDFQDKYSGQWEETFKTSYGVELFGKIQISLYVDAEGKKNYGFWLVVYEKETMKRLGSGNFMLEDLDRQLQTVQIQGGPLEFTLGEETIEIFPHLGISRAI